LEKKSRILNAKERETVAHHEMGHALVALALPGTDPVHKISIIPRGIGALGYTIQRPTEDRYLMTREELEAKIEVILGGRAAEKLIYGHYSTGAADDLVRATDIARSIVARYGMDEKLGPVAYDIERSPFLQPLPGQGYMERRFSEDTAREIDLAVRTLIDRAFAATLAVLAANRDLLERAARELLQVETFDEARLRELTRDLRRPDGMATIDARRVVATTG
jgi:cell division protease FtsH